MFTAVRVHAERRPGRCADCQTARCPEEANSPNAFDAETAAFALSEHKEHTNMKPKNTICLWFDKDAHEAARFYAATFPDSEVTAVHEAPADYPGGKQGDSLHDVHLVRKPVSKDAAHA